MRRTILPLIALLCFSTHTSAGNRPKNTPGAFPAGVFPIQSLALSSPNRDLEPWGLSVGEATVVGLGESLHTDGGYHKTNARLAKFLIERKGFRSLLLETPWAQARVLGAYIENCRPQPTGLEGMQSIFPQFSSTELADLFRWVREFNCQHPDDPVRFAGFDVQQYASAESFSWLAPFDEGFLESFVLTSVPSLQARLEELRLCGPGPQNQWRSGPTNETELQTCQKFLKDLAVQIDPQEPQSFELRTSLLSLHYSAARNAFQSRDRRASSGWRDQGMAQMIQHFISTRGKNKKAVILAHTGHVARNFQEVSNFATKSMGTVLGQIYGRKYFVSSVISKRPSTAAWWSAMTPAPQPGPETLEAQLDSLGLGSFVLDLRKNSLVPKDAVVNLTGIAGVHLSRHVDSLVFLPSTQAMTNFPGVTFPVSAGLETFDPGFESCSQMGSLPQGWSLSGTQGIKIGCDSHVKNSGQWSLALSSPEPHPTAGGIVQCRPTNNKALQIQLSGQLKTRNVEKGFASLAVVALDSLGTIIEKTNFAQAGDSKTTDWHLFSTSLNVPQSASQACWGIVLNGSGQAWADDLQLTVVPVQNPTR